jgi:mannose-6-phosphate isomerase-like protein (cupin superfamily)
MGIETGAPTKFPRTEITDREGRPRCRTIIAPPQGGWLEPAMFEWELTAESWADRHLHSEYNFVIEGQLFVESGGVTVEAHAGDVVRVPPGAAGRYWAPKYARLIAIYGPNPGEASAQLGDEKPRGR